MNRWPLLLLAACLISTHAHAADPPQAAAVSCKQPVRVDGRLDEPCWRRARPISDFHVLGAKGETTTSTTVRFAFDRAWLYAGVVCTHPAMGRVECVHLEHDGSVHTDESIEIFLDPSAAGNPYFHFKLNCANVKAEQRATADGARETGWDSPWLSAVRRHEKGWDAEIAIPLYVLASYGDLGAMRLNVTRNSALPNVDRQGVAVNWTRQLSTWSPMIKSFHEPDLFGRLTGLAVQGLQTPLLVSFDRAAIGNYRLVDGKYGYEVTLDVRGHNHRAGAVVVAIEDRPATGKGCTVRRTVEVKGMTRQKLAVLVPVGAPVQRQTTVTLADAAACAEFGRSRISDTSALDLMSVYLDRLYYTTDAHAVAVCSLGMPESTLRGTVLSVHDASGRELVRDAKPSGDARLAFPIAKLAPGRHTVKVQWRRASGELIFSQDLSLVKRTPKPGREWNIDKLNKVILRNGKPLFPFGLVMAGVTSAHEADIKRVADAGFNSVMHWSLGGSPDEGSAYLDLAARHGLAVLARPEGFARRGVGKEILSAFFKGETLERVVRATRSCGITHLKGQLISQPDLGALTRPIKSKVFARYYEKNLAPMLESVRLSMDRPNCIGFNSFDEPCLSIFDQDVQGRDLHRRIHEVDGYHPVFLLYSSHIPKGEHATDWCDALGTDPYWIPAGMPGRNSPNYVSRIVWTTRQRADAVQKATWIVPMAEFWSGVHKRAILPPEQYCQTYLALIHGAKTLWYFRYPILHQGSWDALAGVARQLRVLGPIAVTPDVAQQVTYDPGVFDPVKREYPDVQVCLRSNPAGGAVLLAANSRPWPVDATYTLSCLPTSGAVGRLFAKDRLAVRDRSFSDSLKPFATRAYTIAEAPCADKLVEIRVAMTSRKAATFAAEQEIPRSGRTGKRNLLANPSFEQASLPGWPDYFRVWYSEPLMGAPNAGCGQDPRDPLHGKVCMRITRNKTPGNGFYFYIAPQHNRPVRYVFSLHLKAERPGMRVTIYRGGMQTKTVKLTTSWQRYHTTGVIPARADRHNMIMVRLSDKGTIWADALQFEQGEEPTAFEE